MARVKTESDWEWIIPMKLTFNSAEVLVKAETESEALQKAKQGDWSKQLSEGELIDWEITGKPEQNK